MNEELLQFDCYDEKEEKRKRVALVLSKNERILSLIHDGVLPKEELGSHPFQLEKWLKVKSLCDNCKSLE